MPTKNHFDVLIIGSGAGGSTLAWRLARSGKRILVLERGDWLKREKENWDSSAVFQDERYKAHVTWKDKAGRPFQPGIHYNVGGNTKVYGAALLRFRKEDFGALRHHGGVSPAWPVGYDEFESYYTEAEHLYEVHGERGQDPTEPWSSAPYRFPAVRHEARIQELVDDLKRLGHQPFQLPLGVRLDESAPHRSLCIKCGTCDGFPCLVDAKSDAQVIALEPALRHPHVTLLTNARVMRLVTDAGGGAVRKVLVERNGAREEYSADVVVLAAGAINSAALLLASANDRHPHGLGNGSGVVGRHYMCHNNSALLAVSKRSNPTVFQKTMGLNDFYFGDAEFPLPMGHIQMLGKSDLVMLKGGAPKLAPGFALDLMAKHAIDFWLTSEDLPDPDNRVTLDADGGIVLSYTENNLAGHQRLVQRLKGLLEHLGCEEHLLPQNLYMSKKIPLAGTAHQCGTVRFGDDARSSALDRNCRMWELDNLYVVDGAFFPSSTAVNPALTIMANALRVGDHLLERLGVAATAAVRS